MYVSDGIYDYIKDISKWVEHIWFGGISASHKGIGGIGVSKVWVSAYPTKFI